MSCVFNSCRPHHKKGNLIRGFLFCFVVDSRANCIIICSWRSITFRYSVGLRPPYTREIRQTKNNYFTQAVPYFNALPLRQIPVENTIPGRSFSLSFAQIASWALFRRACALLTPTTKMRYLCELAIINASFFCIFDVFMRSKTQFFAIYPPVLASTFEYHFFLMTKALRDIFSKSFLFIKIQIVPNPFARSWTCQESAYKLVQQDVRNYHPSKYLQYQVLHTVHKSSQRYVAKNTA